jgi:CRP/FNR family transcriptional regulator, cyclic AMP receptor protein
MAQTEASSPASSLAGVEIFANLDAGSLALIEKRCAWRHYEPGAPILDYLGRSDDVCFIVAGQARANIYSLDGKAITFSDVGPGETFGEYAAIDGSPRSASIEARTRCLVASMSATAFRALLQSEFSALAVNNRIQAELLRLATFAARDGKAAEIDPAPIHADIASRTSTHREAVARELSRLSKLGLIERRGRALVVKDLPRLAALVEKATGE